MWKIVRQSLVGIQDGKSVICTALCVSIPSYIVVACCRSGGYVYFTVALAKHYCASTDVIPPTSKKSSLSQFHTIYGPTYYEDSDRKFAQLPPCSIPKHLSSTCRSTVSSGTTFCSTWTGEHRAIFLEHQTAQSATGTSSMQLSHTLVRLPVATTSPT